MDTTPSRNKTYIIKTIIGFVESQADSELDAWAEVMTEEIGLSDVCAVDNESLATYLRNKGYKTIQKSSRFNNLYIPR